MNYRREIDGLRAVAVIPVILFNAGFNIFSGGFVGVDVFFVISGYLITTIIYGEIQNESFSLARFYERRIRRIFPALFIVSLFCIPFAWLWMLPNEFKSFSKSLIAVNTFASNILFWRETGYFSAASELKPLLHTWSLAVEEQFYVFFPLALLLFHKLSRKSPLLLLVVLTISSIILAEWGSRAHPSASFFLLPTRAWELGIGAILAISAGNWKNSAGWLAQITSTIGIAMVFYAIFTFDETIPFPGFWGLIPVIGTAMIIATAGPQTIVGQILGWKPFVSVGLISYSAYLWHQPLFAFARIRLFGDVSTSTYLGLISLTFVLAYLSWRFIENPCRGKIMFSRRGIFTVAAAFSFTFIAFGLYGYVNHGISTRHTQPKLMATVEQRLSVNYGLSATCEGTFTLSKDCRTHDAPEIIIWGDSFAMHLVDGILSSNSTSKIIQMTKSVCGPFLEISPLKGRAYNEEWAKGCIEFNKKVQQYILDSKTLKYAVLASQFHQYVEPNALIYHNGNVIDSNADFIAKHLRLTLDWLIKNNITPVVFAPPPNNGKNIGLCLARSTWFNEDNSQCDILINSYNTIQHSTITLLKKIEKNHRIVWISNSICIDLDCAAEENNIFIYRDSGHLSHEGSRYLGKKMGFFSIITNNK